MRYRLLVLIALVLFPAGATHAEEPCSRTATGACTAQQLYDLVWEEHAKAADITATTQLTKEVADANVVTTSPSGFAQRVHSSYQDFVNLLSFAIDDIDTSKDGRSLIVRFNPLRKGFLQLGTLATITEPALSPRLLEAFPETGRPAAQKALEARIRDTDDITWSAAATLSTTDCKVGEQRCWGRAPANYRQSLSVALSALAANAPDEGTSFGQQLGQLTLTLGVPVNAKLSTYQPEVRSKIETMTEEAAKHDVQTTLLEGKYYDAAGIRVVAALIENQPQFTMTVNYRSRGLYIGPDETSANLELYWGRTNLNSVAGRCRGVTGSCFLGALHDLKDKDVNQEKFVLSASYTKADAYAIPSLDLGSGITGFVPFRAGRASQLTAKAQYARQLATRIGSRPSKLDFAFEGERNRDNDLLSKNRWIGSLTLTIPVADQISFPITIKYANKPEFLGDHRDDLGIHFGLTYRFPWEPR